MADTPFDPDAEYTLGPGPSSEMGREEIRLLKRIADAVDERVGVDASVPAREQAAEEIAQEDEEFAKMFERLQELSEANPSSVLEGLISVAEDEAAGRAEKMDTDSDAIEAAESALEEHEGELLEKLMELMQAGIPEKATVREAIAEMLRACREDPEAQELIERLAAMKYFGEDEP
ncbi:MAG: hypothetical protein ACM3N0_04155 [Chloroflexota bacterium]